MGELNWNPSVTFEQGLEKTVEWYLANQEWLNHVTSGAYQSYYQNMYSNRS
jgi:dTDP-glucose 4,6-dehydratase